MCHDRQLFHYLYGTTGSIGGSTGTIYRLDPLQKNAVKVIYNAQGDGGSVGTRPFGVVVDVDFTIYGTALDGVDYGTIFKFDHHQASGKILYGFKGAPDGAYPGAPPI